MKKRIISLVLIFVMLMPITALGYTVDDVRDLIGKNRIDGEYTQSEIDIIIEQYMAIEHANEQVKIFEQSINKEERERLAKEYSDLQKELEKNTELLSKEFQSGGSLKQVLKCKSELENTIAKINNFKEKGYDISVEYIPNIWAEEYNKVQENLAEIESDIFEIGELGDALISPISSGFYLTSLYGLRLNPITKDSLNMHYGIDLYGLEGTEVYALWNGIVSNIYESESGGLTIELSHGKNLKTYYMHLSEAKVKLGEEVSQFKLIALSGNTGQTTGPHLHLGIKLDDEFINPLLVFGNQGLLALREFVSNHPEDSESLYELEKVLKLLPTYAKTNEEEEKPMEGIYADMVESQPYSRSDFYENIHKGEGENPDAYYPTYEGEWME